MKAKLISGYGWVEFDAGSGFVTAHELDADFGPAPFKVDVDEWRLNYPGETPDGGEHDILDFGYWWRRGKTDVVYVEPDADWRRQFKAGFPVK